MKTIQNMFEHLHWANQCFLETLQNSEVDNQQIRLFLDILCAEHSYKGNLINKCTGTWKNNGI